jgi:hypothetical protein
MPAKRHFEKVGRDENLKALLPHLSPNLAQRALEALDATRTQVAILAQQSRLDPAEKERLVREAYASIRRERLDEISDDLLALAPYLPADLSDELGRFVSTTFPNILESEHVGAQDPPRTLRLLPVLPEDARADVLSSFLAMAGDGAGWATDLQRLAPYIPHQLLPAAIAAARERLREADRARVLAVLAARLPEPDRGHLLREALAIAQRLHERPGKPEAKRQTLEFLVPFLTEYSPSDLLSAIDDVDDRIFVAQRLAREAPARAPAVAAALRRALPADEDWRLTELHRFSDAAPQDLYALWKSTSRALAASTRAEACAILLRVGPVIRALGGDEAVAETNRALHDVARWWP